MLAAARHEIVPVKGAEDGFDHLPAGGTVTISSSPRFGVDRTLHYAALLLERGMRAVPHLAARDIADEMELDRVVARLGDIGVREVFVIGGDGTRPSGAYSSAIELVDALRSHAHGPERIGVAAYPEGHPTIAADVLVETLLRKQTSADYMTSQICFAPDVVGTWLRSMRAAGVRLPLYVGMPGAVRRSKLVELSLRLGVGPSMRYVSKQRGLLGSVLRPGSFDPGAIVTGAARWLDEPGVDVAGFQVFTFNEVERTVAWERRAVGD
jgi:methylenetetrahydrofolate reductase (NADPH)